MAWQTVPDAGRGDRKCAVADRRTPRSGYDKRCSGCRSQTRSINHLGDTIELGRKVRWSSAVQTTIGEHCQTECYSLRYPQPVEIAKQRSNVVVLSSRVYKSCSRV